MNARVAVWASVLLTLGCSRSFSPAGTQNQPLGTRCSTEGSCASGFCIDGICCEQACAADERCDALGQAGTCTQRHDGEACDTGAQCPSGFCVDGVCCASACTEGCMVCNRADKLGSCAPAPDDTDPRRACADQRCSACFDGACAPALPNTDPDHSCEMGLVCSVDQRCGATDGGACSSNAECATGQCVAGACLYLDDEVISTPTMNPSADARDVAGVARSAAGDLAVLFTESENSLDGSGLPNQPIENEVYLALRPAGGAWSAVPLFAYADVTSSGTSVDLLPALGRVAFLGRQPLVVSQREPDDFTACATDEHPCGLFAVAAAPTGEVGMFEEFDRQAVGVTYMDAVVDTAGRLDVVYTDSRGHHVRQRRSDGTWVVLSDLDDIPGMDPFSAPAIQAVGTTPYLVISTDTPGVAVAFVDGGGIDELPLGSAGLDCVGASAFSDESAKGPARSDRLTISAMCNGSLTNGGAPGRVLRVLYTPDAPQPWSVDVVGEGLGYALLSSDAEWSAEVHAVGNTSYAAVALSWLKGDGAWSAEHVVRLSDTIRPYPTLAVCSDGSLPFAAYGLDGYDLSESSSLTTPPLRGSELHAVIVHR